MVTETLLMTAPEEPKPAHGPLPPSPLARFRAPRRRRGPGLRRRAGGPDRNLGGDDVSGDEDAAAQAIEPAVRVERVQDVVGVVRVRLYEEHLFALALNGVAPPFQANLSLKSENGGREEEQRLNGLDVKFVMLALHLSPFLHCLQAVHPKLGS